jgi:AcrR family transcriptional regulator
MSELDNRKRILTRARELFMQYGIRSVSMDDIAANLGISKKTIYQYFSDKDEIVKEVIIFKIKESEDSCNHWHQVAENAIDELFKIMEMVEEIFRSMNPSVILDLKKYHPAAYAIFEDHRNNFIYNNIRENLLWGIKEELYRSEINVDLMAKFRINTMLLPFDPAFLNKQKLSLAEVEKNILESYLFGLVSLKGYKLTLKYQQKRKIA